MVTSVSAQSYFEKTLLEKQIKPTTAGLNDYFRSLHPDEAQRQRALKLIEQLGTTDSFSAREAATWWAGCWRIAKAPIWRHV